VAVDIASIIAEAIDRSYASSAPEWYETPEFRKYVIESYEKLLAETPPLHETADHGHMQGSGREAYRRGYKSGWKAHKDGAPNKPNPRNPADAADNSYTAGFTAGYGGSTDGQAFLGHYDRKDQMAARMPFMKIAGPHITRLGQEGTITQDVAHDWLTGRGMKNTAKSIRMFNRTADLPDTPDDEHHRPTFGDDGKKVHNNHPADMYDIMAGNMGIRQRHTKKDKEIADAKTMDAANKRGEMDQQRGKVADARPLIEVKEDLETHLFSPMDISGHNEYVRTNGQSGAPNEALQAFRDHPHQDAAEAQSHLNDLWVKSHIAKLEEVRERIAAGEKGLTRLKKKSFPAVVPHPEDPTIFTAPDKKDKTHTFDPIQYMIDRLKDPKGWSGDRSRLRAIRNQLPGFTPGKRVDKQTQDRLNVGVQRHAWDGKLSNATTAAVNLLGDLHPPFRGGHKMWDHHHGIYGSAAGRSNARKSKRPKRSPEALAALAAARAKRTEKHGPTTYTSRHKAEKEVSDAIDYMVGVFQDWLHENVNIHESHFQTIVEDLYSRAQPTYGHLFEVENS